MMERMFGSPWGLLKPLFLLAVLLAGLAMLAGLAGIGEVVDDSSTELITEFRAKGRLDNVNTNQSHGGIKHGEELAETIRHCIDNGGHIQTWKQGDRWVEVCMMPLPNQKEKYDLEHFGLRVCLEDPNCGFIEITCFDLMCDAAQMEEYLIRGGYNDVTILR